MKVIILVFAIIAVASAAPQNRPQVVDASKNAVILRYDNNNIGIDGFSYAVGTSDGQQKEEQGVLENAGTKEEAIAVRGHFSYPGPDGVVYDVIYVADRNGFRAQGSHIPVSSPVVL